MGPDFDPCCLPLWHNFVLQKTDFIASKEFSREDNKSFVHFRNCGTTFAVHCKDAIVTMKVSKETILVVYCELSRLVQNNYRIIPHE